MKRLKSILFLLIISASLFAQTYFQYTQANLNLRKGAGTHKEVILTIPSGELVKIDMSKQYYSTWSYITYKGKSGFVYNNYLGNSKPSTKTWYSTTSNKTYKYSNKKYYTNSKGERVQSPTYYTSPPAGATAICRDGTYSFSRSRRGTCSHHGGVARWL